MKANELSIVAARRLITERKLSSEELVKACFDRIRVRDPQVQAWSYVDEARAIDDARLRDSVPPTGPLHGIPFAVKDVIDVAGMPTGMGSPIYQGYFPKPDAACVSLLLRAGAVVLGKTVTAEFAGPYRGQTRNPLDLSRTPGGSSSGSAAAVADWMAPIAFCTQTAGSTIRPASFCGLVGFKPSYNSIARSGLKFAAESLDTIGLVARTVSDVDVVWRVLVNRDIAPEPTFDKALRIALFRTHHWPTAQPETVEAIERTAHLLRDAGATVVEIPLPPGFDEISPARIVINNYERARSTAWEYEHHGAEISELLRASLEDGWTIPHERYLDAIKTADKWRLWLDDILAEHDAILAPSANGEAPEGIELTGSPFFQEVWTTLQAPAITLPLAKGPNGMPVGVQFIGKRLEDEKLLALANWVTEVIAL